MPRSPPLPTCGQQSLPGLAQLYVRRYTASGGAGHSFPVQTPQPPPLCNYTTGAKKTFLVQNTLRAATRTPVRYGQVAKNRTPPQAEQGPTPSFLVLPLHLGGGRPPTTCLAPLGASGALSLAPPAPHPLSLCPAALATRFTAPLPWSGRLHFPPILVTDPTGRLFD